MTRAVVELLALPRRRQAEAIRAVLADAPVSADPEEWNTRFGPGSLFQAWTLCTVAACAYRANVEVLRPFLAARDGWRVVEVGGGDGRLWSLLLGEHDRGELVVIDPVEEVHAAVAAVLPAGVALSSIVAPVQEVALPACDAVVCSMTLHHVAGLDAAERAAHGLVGPGKREILAAMAAAVAPDGVVIVNEADIHCDLEVPPGELLEQRLIDSYVRRCGLSLVHDIERGTDDDLRRRWQAILARWCLEQVRYAGVPVAERDVYELDVARWLALFARSGLSTTRWRYTDPYALFCQYVLGPA